jgi:hypothetical protein
LARIKDGSEWGQHKYLARIKEGSERVNTNIWLELTVPGHASEWVKTKTAVNGLINKYLAMTDRSWPCP